MKPPRFLRATRTPGERRSAGGSPGPVGVSALPGVAITPKSALTLAAAFACINVVSTDVAALPLLAYRKRKSGGRDQVGDLPAAELLGFSPDGETTSMRWRQAIMGHGLGWGNGYGEIQRGGDGQPTGLHLLDPGNTRPRRRKSDGRLYYEGPGNATYMADDVIHLAGLGFDGLSGYSPPAMLRRAFELGLAAEGMGAAFYGNSSMPRGALRHPGKLSPQAASRLRQNFEAMHRGVDAAFGLAILEEGMEFQQFSINPEDAQFLQVRQFQVLEVCRIYRVPPHKVMDYSQAHLANVEESNLDYIMTTLMPWCEAMEAVCNMKLLTAAQRRQGYYLEHVLAALLRGNMQARASFYEVMERIGVMSPNMIAERENFNPIPDGDVHLVQAQMTTLGQISAAGEAAPAVPEGRNRIAARLNGRGRVRVPVRDEAEGDEDRFNPHHGPDGKFTSPPGMPNGSPPSRVVAKVKSILADPPAETVDTAEPKEDEDRSLRFNPHHGADGKFSSSSGWGGGGSIKVAGDELTPEDQAQIEAHAVKLGESLGQEWAFEAGPPKGKREEKLVEKTEKNEKYLVRREVVPKSEETTNGDVTSHKLGGEVVADTMPNPDKDSPDPWISRRYISTAPNGYDDYAEESRKEALRTSRGFVKVELQDAKSASGAYDTPKDLETYFNSEASRQLSYDLNDSATHTHTYRVVLP